MRKKRNVRRLPKQDVKPKKQIYEVDGYQFRFDDERLQQRFIKTYEHFDSKLNIPLKQPIGYIDAKSMVSGRNYDKLSKILDQYEARDYKNDRKGGLHKFTLFDKLSKSTQNKTINQYLSMFDKLKSKLDKANEDKPPDNPNDVRYNIVYYLNGVG